MRHIPQYHAYFEPVHPCREMETRHCPAVFGAVCGNRPCHRYEVDENYPGAEAAWLAEIRNQCTVGLSDVESGD